MLLIGGVEESNKILENIEKNDFIIYDYYKILNLLDSGKMDKIKLRNHKIEKFDLIKDILKDLKLYRKSYDASTFSLYRLWRTKL